MDIKLKNKLVKEFFEDASPYADTLFDYLSDVYFFVKDNSGRFIKVNSNFLKLFGYTSQEDIIGLTDYDMVSRELAIEYERDDQLVIQKGISIDQKKEPVSSKNNLVSFHITTKIPIYSKDGEIIGLAGITRDIVKTQTAIQPLQDLQVAVEEIEKNFDKELKVEDLALMVNMSVSTFLRRFKKNFHMPPVQYIKKVRINAACKFLLETHNSFGDIASQTGFCDQSYMTREFKKITGLTPSQYRRKYSSQHV